MTEQPDFYRRIWSTVGGRPWTYIYRDVWHRYEWVVQLEWAAIGAAVLYFHGWPGLGLFWAAYTWGYLNGHFFWGTRYKEGQKE